jgi:signal transduction histidine kinase
MRSATLFFLAILTPCAALCWMAWRSMNDETRQIQAQRTAFYQQASDNAARTASEFMTGQLRSFAEAADKLLAMETVDGLRPRFHAAIRRDFPAAEAGLVLETATGRLLPQTEPSEPLVTAFVAEHAQFFQDAPQLFYLEIPAPDASSVSRRTKISALRTAKPAAPNIEDALKELAEDAPALSGRSKLGPPTDAAAAASSAPSAPGGNLSRDTGPENEPAAAPAPRTVLPQTAAPGPPSRLRPVPTTLAAVIARDESGIVSAPHGDRLFTLLWYRPPEKPEMTLAIALRPEAVKQGLEQHPALAAPDGDTCLALLDHAARPAAQWMEGSAFEPESWEKPFAAREIGAALPRWEAAVYLRDPAVFDKAASGARWRLGIIVTAASLVAITGALFILRDARRNAREARMKTDFVSNVSHELKTPLTSIRMFSDLLGSNPAAPPDKTKRYAEVIATETARLTRLINNVLNFSRMEGGNGELQFAPLDLRALTEEAVEHMRPPLERDGFTLCLELPDAPVPVQGDRDAFSQVLLNLLSNAGKYGHGPDGLREITVTLEPGPPARLKVADRGPGVPRGQERRIFEKFQRAHNSLASGTAGSGLGLTIARTLVEAHGGTLEYSSRDGGGAVFTVKLA